MIARLLLAIMLCGLLSAQVIRITHQDSNGVDIVNLTITVVGGSGHGAGLGFAIIDIENLDSRARRVDITHTSSRNSYVDVASHRLLTVEPGVSRFFLPIAIPPERGIFETVVGGEKYRSSANYRHGNGLVSLFVSDRSRKGPDGLRILGEVPSQFSRSSRDQVQVQSEDLPSDWRMLTAFPLIIIDGESGSSAGVSAEVQEALRRFAFAGGTVIVAASESLPAGPLRDVARKAGDDCLAHGLGSVLAIPSLGRSLDTLADRLAQLPAQGYGLWPATTEMFPTQEIEGLGRAPVTMFVLVILAFAILVGPVNFIMLKRRKKPLLALITVPLAGFGTTVVILAYGIFHDGFGVRGVVTTCTLLDQTRHEAVSVQARTLFAGIAPSEMTMNPDTLLLSIRAGRRKSEWPDRWHLDVDTQRLDGGILPSRTITPLLTVQQGPVRDRLTVRRSGDTLEVLPDGNFEPIGELLLRDLDGQFWSGRNGVLQRVAANVGAQHFKEMRHLSQHVRIDHGEIIRSGSLAFEFPDWGQPGTYACQVKKAPWIDEHGLTVEYDMERHFVFGRMHAQDFVQ